MRNAVLAALLLVAPALAKAGDVPTDVPTAIGPLKLGMSKNEVSSIPATSTLHVVGELSPYAPPPSGNYTPGPGEERFDAKIVTPWQTDPIEGVLTFLNGKLSDIYLVFNENEASVRTIVEQVSQKYGPPELADTRRTEQCRLSGRTVEVKSGDISNRWIKTTPTETIRFTASVYTIDSCLSRYRYNIDPKPLATVSLRVKPTAPNPF